jgi:hypothetical protein
MIIDDFDLMGGTFGPDEADSPLAVDANAVLPLAIAPKCFQAISRRGSKIAELRRRFQHPQLSPRGTFKNPESTYGLSCRQRPGILIAKGYNHRLVRAT